LNSKIDRLTAAQEILLGALLLADAGKQEFSEWDLTVSTWKRNPNRFGCRGYEAQYPDHKRVMMEIMGTTKKDNPIRRGWIERASPNRYRLTDIGRSEADRVLTTKGETQASNRSPQPIYDAVVRLYRHPVFRKYCRDAEEPKMWLGAASFLGLTSNDPQHLEDRRKSARTAINNALAWLSETGADSFRRGVSGGDEAIPRTGLLKLLEALDDIEKRFAGQIEAINRAKK
jgi:hypothetical protein